MKRVLSAILVCLLLLSLLPAVTFAVDVVSSGVYQGLKYEITDMNGMRKARITGYTEDLPADVVIPAEIEGVTVTDLNSGAFRDCKRIRTIRFSEGLQEIWDYCFFQSSLTGFLDFPETLIGIGSGAFSYTQVIGCRFNGRYLGYSTTGLPKQIVVANRDQLPNYISNGYMIPTEDFDERLMTAHRVTDAQGLVYLVCDSYAMLFDRTGTGSTFVVPEKIEGLPVTKVANYVFADYTVTSVRLPDTVEEIGFGAFNAAQITEFQTPASLRIIGESVFCSCPYLKKIDLTGVEVIGGGAFSGCQALQEVTLGSTLRVIGDSAFSGTQLSEIALPDSLTELGTAALANNPRLTRVVLPDGITQISPRLFYECTALNEVVLPKNLTAIGEDAFYNTALTSFTVPGTVKNVTDSAFLNLPLLTELTLAEGVETVEINAIGKCPKLQTLILPKSMTLVRSVPDNPGATVYYYTGTEFDLPYGTQNLVTYVNLDTGGSKLMNYLKWIGALEYFIKEDCAIVVASSQSKMPEDLVIPDTIDGVPVTGIGSHAFEGARPYTVTLPAKLETIGKEAFYNNPNLYGLVLPSTLTFCGSDGVEARIWTTRDTDQNRCFYIIAEEGSYGAEYAKRMYYYLFEQTADGPEYVLEHNHVFTVEDGEATLIASFERENGTVDVVPPYLGDIPVTKVAAGAYTYSNSGENTTITSYSGAVWYEPMRTIEDGAFEDVSFWNHQLELYIPASVTEIGDMAFGYSKHNIYGTTGSYAEAYAAAHGHTFYDFDVMPFTDIDETAWYYPAVRFCYWNGLMSGTSATTFAPGMTTSRAMMVQVLFSFAGDKNFNYDFGFKDVPKTAWYFQAVNWAYACKITSGTTATTFSPNDAVTREQVATFLYSFANACGLDTSKRGDLSGYTDRGSVSSWAKTAVQWCVAEGLISGTSTTTLSPKKTATRAEIATILMKFLS